MKFGKRAILVFICGLVLLVSAGCGSKDDKKDDMSNMDHSNMKMEDQQKK